MVKMTGDLPFERQVPFVAGTISYPPPFPPPDGLDAISVYGISATAPGWEPDMSMRATAEAARIARVKTPVTIMEIVFLRIIENLLMVRVEGSSVGRPAENQPL